MSDNNSVPRMMFPSQKGLPSFDSAATKKEGSRKRKGGNPDWDWGCMSGGVLKKRRSRKSKSLKKRTNSKRKTRRQYR
jgi:hypothetical protein